MNFRRIVWDHRKIYARSKNEHKMSIAKSILHQISALDPPGRVLEVVPAENLPSNQDGNNGTKTMDDKSQEDEPKTLGSESPTLYRTVPNARAIEKTCQALRERKAIRPLGYESYKKSQKKPQGYKTQGSKETNKKSTPEERGLDVPTMTVNKHGACVPPHNDRCDVEKGKHEAIAVDNAVSTMNPQDLKPEQPGLAAELLLSLQKTRGTRVQPRRQCRNQIPKKESPLLVPVPISPIKKKKKRKHNATPNKKRIAVAAGVAAGRAAFTGTVASPQEATSGNKKKSKATKHQYHFHPYRVPFGFKQPRVVSEIDSTHEEEVGLAPPKESIGHSRFNATPAKILHHQQTVATDHGVDPLFPQNKPSSDSAVNKKVKVMKMAQTNHVESHHPKHHQRESAFGDSHIVHGPADPLDEILASLPPNLSAWGSGLLSSSSADLYLSSSTTNRPMLHEGPLLPPPPRQQQQQQLQVATLLPSHLLPHSSTFSGAGAGGPDRSFSLISMKEYDDSRADNVKKGTKEDTTMRDDSASPTTVVNPIPGMGREFWQTGTTTKDEMMMATINMRPPHAFLGQSVTLETHKLPAKKGTKAVKTAEL